jgi:hypothetical protein
MIVRLSAAVLLNGLILGSPVLADPPALDPDRFLGFQETGTVAILETDPVSAEVVPPAVVSAREVSTPVETAPQEIASGPPVTLSAHENEDEIAASIDLAAALDPVLFADPNEGETFAWIAADLAGPGDITTGSIPQDEAILPVTGDHAEFAVAATPALRPLTEDAFSAPEVAP